MPEGHTIHRLARDLTKAFADRAVTATSPQGRFQDGAGLIDGGVLHRASAFGKHLFMDFDAGNLHVHLGLIGKFRPAELGSIPRETIRLRLETNQDCWDLTGPQDCRLIDEPERDHLIDRLGPDPLRRGSRPDRFIEQLSQRRIPIGAALLDQAVIAGIGNVYRAEFLFMLGIDPHRAANDLTCGNGHELWDLAKDQLRQGVRLNRIVTVTRSDSGRAAGRLSREESLYVYKRDGEPCRRCGETISIGEIGGRSCWWCPRCQR